MKVVASLDDARARRWVRELATLHRRVFDRVDGRLGADVSGDHDIERMLEEIDAVVGSLEAIQGRVRHREAAAQIRLVVASHQHWVAASQSGADAGPAARRYFSCAARLAALMG